jgi:hypothetical protein
MSLPITEVATRLTKQYIKLAQGMAIYHGNDYIGDDELRVLKQVAIHTAPSMPEILIRTIYKNTDDVLTITRKEILEKVPFSEGTLTTLLTDMQILGLIKLVSGGPKKKSEYKLTGHIKEIIEVAKIYQ